MTHVLVDRPVRRAPFVLALAAALALGGPLAAQSVQVQAYYPLAVDLDDATSNYGPVTLSGTPTPAPPANGVCHNGQYLFGSTPGQDIRTANITTLTDTDFQVEIEFRIEAFTGANRPILVGGNGWRWIGFYTDANGTLGVLYNNSNYTWSTTTVVAGRWYAAVIKFENGNLELFLDGALVHTANIGSLNTSNDFDFTTNNFSNGAAFFGCIRKIRISNDATLGLGSVATATNHGDGCDGLSLDANGVPTIGNLGFELEISNVPAVSPVAFLGFGTALTVPGVDLTPAGMSGCFAYTNLDLGLYGPQPVTAGATTFPLPIVPNPALAGYALVAQAAAFTTTTAIGVASSNGTRLIIGL